MPYYYATTSQQTTNSSANTDGFLADLKVALTTTSPRLYVQKLIAGSYATPSDVAIRLRFHRITTIGTYASGSSLTPAVIAGDAPVASGLASTVPVPGTAVLSTVPVVQLAYNQRGTAMWAAFTADEAVCVSGANNVAGNGILLLDSQSTGTSIPVNFEIIHAE